MQKFHLNLKGAGIRQILKNSCQRWHKSCYCSLLPRLKLFYSYCHFLILYWKKKTHPIQTACNNHCSSCIQGCRGRHYSQSQWTLNERQGNTRTSYQVITWLADRDKQKLTFMPYSDVESPISRPCMSLDCGRKQRYPQGTHTGTVRTTPRQKKLLTWESNPGPSCRANRCTTALPSGKNDVY